VYNFKFVTVTKGKTKTEIHGSCHEAHVAMGMYAAHHDLNLKIHPGRWQEDARSIMFKGDDPMFGAVGYVAQCAKGEDEEEEE
jgi:hypothetical protein